MPVTKGKNSDAKKILIFPDDIEGDDTLLSLTDRHRDILLVLSEYLDWKTRWANLPSPLDDDDIRDEYVSDIKRRLMEVINFCEKIIECITSDADTQQALVDWLIQALAENELLQQAVTNVNYYNNGHGLPSNPGTSGNVLIKADCDKDTAAGFVMEGIIERGLANIRDMFDVFTALTNEQEKKLAFLDMFPFVGELLDIISVFDIVGFVNNVVGWIDDQFEAEDTTELRERWARDLLCIYMQDCELSMEQIRDYFWKEATKANSGFNDAIGTAVDMFNFLINGTSDSFVGIAPVLMGTQFGGFYFIEHAFGMSLADFKILIDLGDPTDDWIAWETLYGVCECFDIYTPDNVGIYEVFRGIVGIEGVFASSDIETSGGNRHQITIVFADLQVTDALAIEFITNRPIIDGASGVEFTVDGSHDSPLNATNSYFVSPDKWGIRIDFASPITDGIEDILIRQNIGDVTNDFSFVEFRIYYAC